MAYFAPFIDGEGIHIPTYQETLDYLIDGYKNIFGDDIYLGEDTQDYQLLSLYAKAQDDANALTVQNYNSRDPNLATGDALDMMIALNAMSRKKATASKVILSLTGTAGATIPQGSKAIDENGCIWSTERDCTLDENGAGSVNAYCDTLGDIVANAGTINTIYNMVPGWNTVTNANGATPGNNTETEEELRYRRSLSVSMNTNGTFDALVRAVASLPDVDFVDVRVNDTNETDANGIPGHSVCVLVQGGDDDEIAEAIWKNKAPGVGTHGTTTKTYVDSEGNGNPIKFTRPAQDVVTVTVSIAPYGNFDADRCLPIIRGAIIGSVNGMGVGKPWGVTLAYRDIYNSFGDEEVPFVVTGISGTNSIGTSATVIECDYNKILHTDEDHIDFSVNNS